MFMVGWKLILVITALPEPRLSSYNNCPSSELKILIIVPFIEPVAIRVPSPLTARAPMSDSCAWIKLSMLLSTM
jgi:hypothetical protein